MMRGSAKADVYFMLAHPVGHAKSPGMFNELFEQKGLDSLMVPVSCRPEDFDAFWAGMTATENVRGAIISVPYKSRAFQKCAATHDRAARVESLNVVRRQADGSWYGDNLDGVGFMKGLAASQIDLAGRSVLQVGTGGAGATLAYCLAEGGASALRLVDIDPSRAAALADRVKRAFPACEVTMGAADPAGMDIAINATPVGMRAGDPLPMDIKGLRSGMTVVDIIMEPAETPLLKAAREAGCKVQPGRPMMDHQMEAMAEFFDIDRKERNNG